MKKHNTIFLRILCIMLPAIFVSLITIGFSCLFISKHVLLDEVISIAKRNFTQAQKGLLDYNSKIAIAISKISSSNEFKNYILASEPSTLESFNLVTDIGHFRDDYEEYITPESSYYIVSSALGNEGRYYTSNPSKWDTIPNHFFEKYLMKDGKVINQIVYHSQKGLFEESSPYLNNIMVTKPLYNPKDQLIGYIVVIVDEAYVASTYEDYVTDGMTISLITQGGVVLSSSDKSQLYLNKLELFETIDEIDETETSPIKVLKTVDKTIIGLYLPFYDAYLIGEIYPEIVFSSLEYLRDYIILIIFITLILTGIFVFIFSRYITNPLRHLAKHMTFTETHDFKSYILDNKGSEEIQLITEAYNTMLDNINKHVTNLISEQEQRRKAELTALQMQINPHFLYNTLSSIKYLAKQQRIDEVDETIHSLISILQNVIGTADEMTTVRDEIKNLGYFVYINQVRYGDGIKANYQISEDCKEFMIPKLIIQPFIENSFFHGFAGLDSGTITVYINQYNGVLNIEIIDNGIGMECSDTVMGRKKYHFTGIGINNVDERIKLLYGDDFGIKIQSEVGIGTSILINLPSIQKNETHQT
ncbi:HAMP domain-containing protein [Turicibacter sanguinis]|uniref:HAMP domain-containing protein n=1 Tax=Turicibacter sanguinis TaxID=154288 RepID=A0A9X5ANS0_9FIRM|nr:HAMP domain-containing protein [Turicibacter sanguinis]